MGQAKLKMAAKPDKVARAGTTRLHSVEFKAQFVSYDEHGRAIRDGTGATEPFMLMEADLPADVISLVRKQFPKLEFVTIELDATDEE
jgi:hypothetical protein